MDVTDDSVLRAVAAAPARLPPPTALPPKPSRPRRWPTLAALALIAVGLVALGKVARDYVSVGTPIPSWRFGTTPVTLPTNLSQLFHMADASYVLETDVSLAADLRGQPLTIAVDCFHAPLALTVDGATIADSGDLGVGEHRYALDASRTDRAQLHLTLAAHRDVESRAGFGVAPRIALASETRDTVATFNRYTTTVAAIIAALLAFLYGILCVLDRRREYVVLVVGIVASIVLDLYTLDVLPRSDDTVLGRLSGQLLGLTGAMMFVTVLYFVHLAFELGRPPRWLRVLWGVVIVLMVASPAWRPLLAVASVGLYATGFATSSYLLVRCLGITGAHRLEAQLVLFAWIVPQLASGLVEQQWWLAGVHHVGGLHGTSASLILLVLVQVTVLVLQFVGRQRTIEHTADELRRMVAERSKELAEALGQLADRPQSSLVGKTVDARYRVLAQLGAGGMGTVYEVERTSDGARLALKTLRAHIDAKLMARFAREAQFAAELRHPNLVPVIDVGIADGTLYLVMELVADSLEKDRARFGDRKWATPIIAQIASGLAAIHARGIVHRDLKPANILLDRGVARIADFGLAALHVGAFDETTPQSPMLTRAGDVFGTPAYMAPELAAGTSNAAPSSDVFGFGVIAHELVTGRSPFAEPPVLARLHGRPIAPIASPGEPGRAATRSVAESIASPGEPGRAATRSVAESIASPGEPGRAATRSVAESIDPTTPGDVDPLLLRCLDLDPAKRPTADELVTALRG